MEQNNQSSNNTPQASYAVTRYNATQHGILSRQAVLPWEDRRGYEDLLQSLDDEYLPETPTEAHLVEELAGIMWRKVRLRQAEAAHYCNQIANEIAETHIGRKNPVIIAALLTSCDNGKGLKLDSNTLAYRKLREEDIKALNEILEHGRQLKKVFEEKGYEAFLEELDEEGKKDLKEFRQKAIQANEQRYQPQQLTEEGIAWDWANENIDGVEAQLSKDKHADAVKSQLITKSYLHEQMEILARYETHLDRRFERILTVLLKLKEIKKSTTSA
jgi:hypothetical protein